MKKKTVLILLAVVLAAVLIAAAAVLLFLNRPEIVLGRALLSLPDDFLARQELAPFAGITDGGSVTFSLCPDTEKTERRRLELDGTLYFSDDGLLLQDGNLFLIGKNHPFALYYGEEYFYFSGKTSTEAEPYGFVRGEAKKGFENSVWKRLLPDVVGNILDVYDKGLDKTLLADAEALIEKDAVAVYDLLTKHADFSSERTETTVGGETIKARVVTVRMDADAAIPFLEELLDLLESDGNLISLARKYAPGTDLLFGEGGAEAALKGFLSGCRDGLPELREKMERNEIALVFRLTTPKWKAKLLKCSLSLTSGRGEDVLLVLDAGEAGIKETDCIRLSLAGETLNYAVSEDSGDRFRAGLTLQSSLFDTDSALYGVELDRTSGGLTLTLGDGLTLRGSYSEKKHGFAVQIDEAETENGKGKPDLSLTLDLSDDMPDPTPKENVKSPFTFGESQIRAVLDFFDSLFG